MKYKAKTYTGNGKLLEAEFECHNKEDIRAEAEKAMKKEHGSSKVMCWSPINEGGMSEKRA